MTERSGVIDWHEAYLNAKAEWEQKLAEAQLTGQQPLSELLDELEPAWHEAYDNPLNYVRVLHQKLVEAQRERDELAEYKRQTKIIHAPEDWRHLHEIINSLKERAEAAERELGSLRDTLAAWSWLEAELAAVRAKAEKYEEAMFQHGCDSSYVCGFCEKEYGPTGSPTNSGMTFEDWQKRRALMMERDDAFAASGKVIASEEAK